jgi:hypothetical protein
VPNSGRCVSSTPSQFKRNAWCHGQRPAIRALMRSIDRLLDAHIVKTARELMLTDAIQ